MQLAFYFDGLQLLGIVGDILEGIITEKIASYLKRLQMFEPNSNVFDGFVRQKATNQDPSRDGGERGD